MDHYTHFVGIDVSKHTLDVMLWHRHQDAIIKADKVRVVIPRLRSPSSGFALLD